MALINPFRISLAAILIASACPVSVYAQGAPEGSRPRAGGDQPEDGRRRGQGGGEGRGGGGGGMFGGRNNFEPSVTSRSLDSFSKVLGLTADQQTAAKALLDGYQQSFDTLAGEARDKMSEMRETMRAEMADEGGRPGPDSFRKMGEEMDKFRKARTDMEQSFFNDLKAVLTPEQSEKWPSVERMHRREQTIGRGLMSGERVDLVKLVDDLKLPDAVKTPLNPVLDQYAADLDRELVARNAAYDATQSKMREMFQNREEGGAGMDKVFEDGRNASERVRDVNRRYARQVEGLLPDDAKQSFNDSFRRQSFPTIYRSTYATRALNAAAEMTDLDATQKTTVTTIKESYTRDLAAINKELEAATEKREASVKPQDFNPGRGGGGGPGGWGAGRGWGFENDPELAPLVERRSSLQDSTIEKLKTVLSAEQFAALPQRGGGRGEGGGGDDGEGRQRRREREERPAPAPKPAPKGPGPV